MKNDIFYPLRTWFFLGFLCSAGVTLILEVGYIQGIPEASRGMVMSGFTVTFLNLLVILWLGRKIDWTQLEQDRGYHPPNAGKSAVNVNNVIYVDFSRRCKIRSTA